MCSGVVRVVLGPLQQESKCIFEMEIEHRVFKSAVPTNKKIFFSFFLLSPQRIIMSSTSSLHTTTYFMRSIFGI